MTERRRNTKATKSSAVRGVAGRIIVTAAGYADKSLIFVKTKHNALYRPPTMRRNRKKKRKNRSVMDVW